MASTDARPIPVKNTAYRVTFPILDADGDLVTAAAGLDSEVSKDAGTFADCTNEATEIATSSGMYYLDLTSTEMNCDCVAIIVKTSTTGAKTVPIVLYPQETGDIKVDVQSILGTLLTETSGQIAAGFKKLFDVAAPVFTLVSVNQTGDSFVRLGAPVGASHSADVAAVKTDTAAIKTKTDSLTFTVAGTVDANVTQWKGATAPANTGDAFARLGVPAGASTSVDIAAIKAVLPTALVGGRIDASIGAVASGVISATSFAANALDAVWSTATRLLSAGTNIVLAKGTGVTGFTDLSASDVRSAVGLASANLDSQLSTISLQIPSANTVADATLDRTDGIETSYTLRSATRLILAAISGRVSGGGTAAETVRDINNTKNRLVYTVDANGNRTNVAIDPS